MLLKARQIDGSRRCHADLPLPAGRAAIAAILSVRLMKSTGDIVRKMAQFIRSTLADIIAIAIIAGDRQPAP